RRPERPGRAPGGAAPTPRRWSYDAAGDLLTAADRHGGYVRSYDALGRLQAQRDLWGLTLTFGYDAAGNRIRQADSAGGLVESGYDAAGRLTSRRLTAGGVWLQAELTYTPRGDLQAVRRTAGTPGPQQVLTTVH